MYTYIVGITSALGRPLSTRPPAHATEKEREEKRERERERTDSEKEA